MDAKRFDTIVRSLTAAGTRRGVLGFLATLPLLGGLGLVASEDGAEAAKRRKRNKRSQQTGQSHNLNAEKKRKKKKKCKPKSQTTTCAGKCGPVKNTCKKTVNCGSCACDPGCAACFTCQEGPNTVGTCVVDTDQVGEACGACGTCDGSGQCVGCDAGLDCCGDACVDLQSDSDNCGACGEACEPGQSCQGGVCGFTCGGDFCPSATEICDGGTCHACDVCTTCTHTIVQEAVNEIGSGTVRICAGAYRRLGDNPVVGFRFVDLSLVGAGAESTILDGGGIDSTNPVLFMRDSTSTVRQLTVTGARGASGIWNFFSAELTLEDVIVSENVSPFGAGIFNEGVLTLNAGTIVRGNGAIGDSGGGIVNAGEQASLTLNDGARVTGNTAAVTGGGIVNAAGTVVLNAGSEVSGNDSLGGAGGIANTDEGTVTLHTGSVVCGNSNPECAGFNDPNTICQDDC
jgi:hypothetical protein